MAARSLLPRALLATALVATACGGGAAASPAASGGAARPAFEQVLEGIDAKGHVPLGTALQAFALTFGPLPGVSPPSGPAERIPSGTGPLRWTIGHLEELTPAQRQVVDAVVHPAGHAIRASLEGDAPQPLLAAGGEDAKYASLVAQAQAYFGPKLGLPHQDTTVLLADKPDPSDSGTLADTACWDASGGFSGKSATCQITVYPNTRSSSDAVQKQVVFHEVFHCFEASGYTDLQHWYVGASWLMEGGAEWASAVAAGPDDLIASRWTTYFATPGRGLLQRSYDALGFFAHLENRGASPWARFAAAFAADSGDDSLAAVKPLLGGDAQSLLDTWPTGMLRDSSLGADYETDGPGIAGKVTPPLRQMQAGQSAQDTIGPYANSDAALDVEADVVIVGAGPHSRLRAVAGGFDSPAPSGTYCTLQTGCSCPAGSSVGAPEFTKLPPGSYYLSSGGGAAGSGWAVATFTLDDFCKQPRVDSCLIGTWKMDWPALSFQTPLIRQDGPGSLVVSFSKDGVVSVDLGPSPTYSSTDPTAPETVKLDGVGTASFFATHGVIEVSGADFSRVQAKVVIFGTDIGMPLTELFPNIPQSVQLVTYRCSGNTLSVDDPYTGTDVFTRG